MRNERIHAVKTTVEANGTTTEATETTVVAETMTEAIETTVAVETTTEAIETIVVVETTTEATETTVVVETTTEAIETIVVVGMASVARLPITIGPVLNATIRTSRSATSAIGVKSLAQAVEAVDNVETIPEAVFVNKAVSETTEGPATDGAKGVHRVDVEDLDSRTDARPIPPSEDQRGSVRATPTTNLQKISEIHLVNLNGKTTERM